MVGLIILLPLLWINYHLVRRSVTPIEASYNKQKQFVADASHEFKTPLAIISANIDAIETISEETVASQAEWFGYIKTQLQRATNLVDSLLYLAQASSHTPSTSLPLNLSDSCEKAAVSMEAVFFENNLVLHNQIEKNIWVPISEAKLMQVLYILLDNAGKYTQPGGEIILSLKTRDKYALLEIANTAEPLAQQDLARIFDRFYRPDASRSHETGGFGLGLAIAKAIIEDCGGQIQAHNLAGKLIFTIKLPLLLD